MIILYFTATGNSLYVAKQLGGKLVSIPQATKKGEYIFKDDQIGIVCPLYYNHLPKLVVDYLGKSILDSPYKFLILTYGYNCVEPIEIRTHAFNYISFIHMVDNYLPLFDISKDQYLEKNVDYQIEEIKKDILNKRNFTIKLKVEKLKKTILERYFSQPSKLNDGSSITITDKCIGCGICVKVCPTGNFYIENGISKRKEETCMFCLACANLCTNKAIICKYADKNPKSRYKNKNISLCEIIQSNRQ